MTEAQGQRVIEILEDILFALVGPEEQPVCAHPADQRIDLSSMTEVEWICGTCKHHHGPVTKEKTHAAVSQQSV